MDYLGVAKILTKLNKLEVDSYLLNSNSIYRINNKIPTLVSDFQIKIKTQIRINQFNTGFQLVCTMEFNNPFKISNSRINNSNLIHNKTLNKILCSLNLVNKEITKAQDLDLIHNSRTISRDNNLVSKETSPYSKIKISRIPKEV